MNVYYDPEKFGLKEFGEIDYVGGGYEFDLRIVWVRTDGLFVTARDAGCSCPTPFDDFGLDDLDGPFTAHEMAAFIQKELSEASEYERLEGAADAADLCAKLLS